MYARNVSFGLKPNMQAEFTRTLENQILPLLHKQKSFKEEITLCSSGSVDAVCKVIEGTPRILTYDKVVSTFHVVPAAV